MAIVFATAIAFAALRAQSDMWASGLYTSLMAALMMSAIGLVCRRGRRRAFWAGFAIVAAGYAMLSFGPWAHQGVMPPTLLTTKLLFHWELAGKRPGQKGRGDRPFLQGTDSRTVLTDGYALFGPPVADYGGHGDYFARESASLHQIAHASLAIILGLAGAQLAFVFWMPREGDRLIEPSRRDPD
jgi:hypothetical protein